MARRSVLWGYYWGYCDLDSEFCGYSFNELWRKLESLRLRQRLKHGRDQPSLVAHSLLIVSAASVHSAPDSR